VRSKHLAAVVTRLRSWWPPGLRTRVTTGFALGALVVSAALSLVTWQLTSHYLLRQREAATLRQATVDARLLASGLDSGAAPTLALLGDDAAPGSDAVLYLDGRWYGSSLGVGRDSVPSPLRAAVVGGAPSRQRVLVGGQPRLVVGLPLPNRGAYFESFPLVELDRTLRTLSQTLAAVAVATAGLGAFVGIWAGRRALRPLGSVASAAANIAAGNLGTRLNGGRDPDLTRLADSFNSMVTALQDRIARDARFASDVSHELRAPLTVMVNSMSVLRAGAQPLAPPAREALELLADEVDRFVRLVGDLLEISQLDSGPPQPASEPVLLGELVSLAADTAAGRPVTHVQGQARALVVHADRRRLERVVVNLVQNAESHGGGVSRVDVTAGAGVALVSFEDHGPGVREQDRTRVFERFVRLEPHSQEYDGHGASVGLGLALVAEHVRLHGGRVWVEEGTAGGARFVVALPVAAP